MAATRFILAPIGGVFVATSLLYTFRHTIAVRTHDTAVALNRIKLQLNDIDPDNWDKQGKERVTRQKLRPAYVAPARPSVTEEIKARWNEHLIGAVDKLINANYYDLFANGMVFAKNMISEKLGNSDRSSSSSSNASVGTPLATQQTATGGIKTGVIDTQHVSLRNESSAALAARDAIRGAGSSVGSRLARAVGMDAGKVDKVVEAKTGAGLGRVADGPAGRTFYLGEGTSLR
ncbi:hypothetical protein NDA11_007567 [Ustilago hordei]|uniref:MICOS complex subunit MIC12 n=1 Tax=Ustilago hordei TaxID=120017 RepID=I2FQ13_USTHO|nr:uncharacterized protein UHO2_06363 [Ustilago hordei]KAJ1038414.1 hypothetical protein NDA10_007932 [Ustilago hordei]KAJ1570367.1 hypothetical protein NDA15_003437 [Ustilago hordei]KAJ1571889.1 hypothetical protein NDA12_007616 [Ustilago hordei]KAJ1576042.1 hypothetical protein NDA11_007567 [Ustilago hordei]KAJ1604092.1 hypothetical protein NDA14_000278 [Ustilago hordei]